MADVTVTANGVRVEVEISPDLAMKLGRATAESLLAVAASPETWQRIKAAADAAEAADEADAP